MLSGFEVALNPPLHKSLGLGDNANPQEDELSASLIEPF